jgi:hypothetical protein
VKPFGHFHGRGGGHGHRSHCGDSVFLTLIINGFHDHSRQIDRENGVQTLASDPKNVKTDR